MYGDATRPGVLAAPDPIQARVMLDLARRANPAIDVVVRTHSDAERAYLERRGVGLVVLGEHELAAAMTRYAVASFTRDSAGD